MVNEAFQTVMQLNLLPMLMDTITGDVGDQGTLPGPTSALLRNMNMPMAGDYYKSICR